MKVVHMLVLIIIFGAISCQKAKEKSVENMDGFGYELLVFRLESMQEEFSNDTERLLELISSNESKFMERLNKLSDSQKTTADKISALEESIAANNSRITERITKIESAVEQNRKFLEEQINVIKMNLSAVADNIQRNTIDESTKSILLNNSRYLGRRAKIESARAAATKMIESAASDNTKIIEEGDCKAVNKSGVYRLERPAKTVYCEMTTLGGGWLVIQQRVDLKISFYRTWNEYRDGFGVVAENENFWLGNEAVHQITSGAEYELAIEWKGGNDLKQARYPQFRLAGEHDKYRLTVGRYAGSLKEYFRESNNRQFSTYDNDNDGRDDANCASWYGSGWWFKSPSPCSRSNLNHPSGPHWDPHHGNFSRMMIRHK